MSAARTKTAEKRGGPGRQDHCYWAYEVRGDGEVQYPQVYFDLQEMARRINKDDTVTGPGP